MRRLSLLHEGKARLRARGDNVFDLILPHDVVRRALDGLVLVADGLEEHLVDLLEVRRDVVRVLVLRPVAPLGIDDDGHAVRVRCVDDRLTRLLRAGTLAVVRDDERVEALVELLLDVVLQALAVDGRGRVDLLEVEPQHLLMPADDAQLRRRRLVRMHEPAEIDAARREPFLQALAVVVLADEPREARLAAEQGEVVRDVRRAAKRLLRREHMRDGNRRLRRYARDLAVVILVEHDVADDEDVAFLRRLSDE